MSPRVLVVEDEGLIALHLAETLVRAGFGEPAIFSSGEDLLEHLSCSAPPEAILMDIGLAGNLSGIETARRIRRSASVPIIFLTAYSDGEKIARAAEVPASSYLVKPVGEQDLVAALRSATSVDTTGHCSLR